jgi:L-gulono-1,4-lactone dehydrogenase
MLAALFKFLLFVLVVIVLVFRLEYRPVDYNSQKKLKFWTDYSKRQVCHPHTFHQPKTEEELINIIKNTTKNGQKLKIVAAGHAMSSIAMSNENLVNLDYLNKLKSVQGNIVTVQGGIRLKELVEVVASHGLAMNNLGQILEQSIAGAISTSTHGSTGLMENGKLKHGSISTQVVSLKLIDSNGNIHVTSKTQNPDLFSAAKCGLGAIGVILEVSLECEKAFNLELTESIEQFTDVLANYKKTLSSNEYFRFWWIPGANVSKSMTFKRTALPTTVGPFQKFMKRFEVPLLINILNIGKFLGNRRIMKFISNLLAHKVAVDRSDQALTGPVPETYTEMEYFFPIEKFEEIHEEFRKYILSSKVEYNFVAEVRFVAADDIWLSPFYKRDSVSLSVVLYDQNDVWKEFSDGLEVLYAKYGGRPHWGKHHSRNAENLKPHYEKWNDFLKIRETMDPHKTFVNEYLEASLGI